MIPGENYILLYDATPFKILNGHVAAKLPCDNNNATEIQVLIGQNIPEFEIAKSEFIPQLSDSGNLCLYHFDIKSTSSKNPITEIIILNIVDISKISNNK